jgi:dTDP-4-amino-4,6-dideoxygalactose transaminase
MDKHARKPIRATSWPTYDKGHVFVHDSDIRAASRALERRLYFRYDYRDLDDTEVGKLERRLAAYFGTRHALAVSSGTTAIALGLMAAGVKPGSLVACPGFTFAATPSAIVLAGCTPLLIECDNNLHLDVADLRRKLTPEVKAIVVVHMRGFASDAAAVAELAREANIVLVEDAVPALGASLHGQKLGTFGSAGAFSTQSDKSLNTGEGGFLICSDPELFARAVILSGAYEGRFRRHFADPPPPICDLDYPIFSFRMDEIRGALAAAEMERLPLRLAVLRDNYEYISRSLATLGELHIRQPIAPGALLGDSLIFRLPGAGIAQVVATVDALRIEGIEARALGAPGDANVRCFWNWRFLFAGKSPDEIKRLLPSTACYLSEAIDIPLSPTLTVADCNDLIQAIAKVVLGKDALAAARRDAGEARPQGAVR